MTDRWLLLDIFPIISSSCELNGSAASVSTVMKQHELHSGIAGLEMPVAEVAVEGLNCAATAVISIALPKLQISVGPLTGLVMTLA
jgi:hypothetical protein